jgi:uridine kinase
MDHLTIEFCDELVECSHGIRIGDFLHQQGFHRDESLIGAKFNNRLVSLQNRIKGNGKLEVIGLDGNEGHRMYRQTLCFLVEMALHRMEERHRIEVGHSLGNGYYFSCRSEKSLSEAWIADLEKAMKALVEKDYPIIPHYMSYTEALDHFTDHGLGDSSRLTKQRNMEHVPVVTCDDFLDLDHFPLAASTGALTHFSLMPYEEGFVLLFPPKRFPLVMEDFKEKPLLYSIYKEYNQWGEVLEVPTVGALNDFTQSGQIAEFIQVAEALHEQKLSDIAGKVAERRNEVKAVLIAGPSSSGKTTFTKKLAVHLKVVGFRPKMISLDDYFVEREKTPKDKNGNYDFESLNALDINLLNQHLLDLFEGREVEIPIFDFKTGRPKKKGRLLQLGPKDILMMEGIHGINEQLTPKIPRSTKFKIYISALTQLGLDRHHRISTTDNRLIRRMARDYQFRGYSALHTLRMWPSVRRGEARNIFPFQEEADAFFNSALDYELAVLRNLAVPLLRTVPPTAKEFAQAAYLLDFLEYFVPIQLKYVPTYSILREFMGDSGFKY